MFLKLTNKNDNTELLANMNYVVGVVAVEDGGSRLLLENGNWFLVVETTAMIGRMLATH